MRTRVIQDPCNGDKYQAQYKSGELPWFDIGDGKETRAEAETARTEFELEHPEYRTGRGVKQMATEFDMQAWLQQRRDEHIAAANVLYAGINESAAGREWTVSRNGDFGVSLTRNAKAIAVDLSGGIICALLYYVGDGRHFAIDIDDERRHASGMTMSEILDKWTAGREPNTHIGAP